MKKITLTIAAAIVLTILAAFKTKNTAPNLKGSWKMDNGVMICSESYFSLAYFNVEKKRFDATIGGRYSVDNGDITFDVEYSYPDKSLVGQSETIPFKLDNGKFTYEGSQGTMEFAKVNEITTSPLAALWRITSREDKDGKMVEMPKTARKTIKLLTDNRFQWAAINTETGEFFGTGGGTYTLKDGKYTETIEFFSRDSSRVGASLSFDAIVNGTSWQHKGKSSTGNPVNEIWTKQD